MKTRIEADDPLWEELLRHFRKEKMPDKSQFRGAIWKQLQDNDKLVFVLVRATTVFDDQYGQSSMP